MLENLVIAVESESQIVDIARVSGFMQKVSRLQLLLYSFITDNLPSHRFEMVLYNEVCLCFSWVILFVFFFAIVLRLASDLLNNK